MYHIYNICLYTNMIIPLKFFSLKIYNTYISYNNESNLLILPNRPFLMEEPMLHTKIYNKELNVYEILYTLFKYFIVFFFY